MNHLIMWQQYYFSDILKYYTKICELSNDNERIINEIQI